MKVHQEQQLISVLYFI